MINIKELSQSLEKKEFNKRSQKKFKLNNNKSNFLKQKLKPVPICLKYKEEFKSMLNNYNLNQINSESYVLDTKINSKNGKIH